MKADFSRSTFRPLKHFTRVLVQQGRVQLDAELNEQVAMLLDYVRRLAADLIGKAGGPEGNCGFEIFPPFSSPNQGQDFQIGFGNYYVDGLLCQADFAPIPIFPVGAAGAGVFQVTNWDPHFELTPMPRYEVFDDTPSPALGPVTVALTISNQKQNQITITNASPDPNALNWLSGSTNPRLRRIITYLHQPDYPYLVAQGVSPTPPPLPLNTAVQIYLDVWEHAITYAQDDYIREVALGGADTTARAKLVWQVKYTDPVTSGNNPVCMSPQLLEARFQPPNRGWLQARAKQGSQTTDPCIIAPNASYTGPENQLYRVEINRAGPAWTGPSTKDGSGTNDALAATFKWSRENGSPVYPIESGGGTLSVQVESLGRDDRFGLKEGDYVEVQDDRSILMNESNDKNLQTAPPVLLQVQAVDQSALTVTLAGTADPSIGKYPALHPILRRWDQRAGDPEEDGLTLASDNAAYVQEGEGLWLTLEDGVQISFQPADPVQNPGDKAPTNWYRTGDYWLIPARTATADVEWPKVTDSNGNFETDAAGNTIPLALPPHGITHHYAPLAVISQNADTKIEISDCRGLFDNGVEAEKEEPGEQEPTG